MKIYFKAALVGSILVFSTFFFIQDTYADKNRKTVAGNMKKIQTIMLKFSHLPMYCQIRLTERELVNNKQKIPDQFAVIRDKWLKRIGSPWYASHHLCWGLDKFQKASLMKFDDPNRNQRLKQVIAEFNYVRNGVKARGNAYYGLWPVLLEYEYKTYLMLQQFDNANRTLREIERYKNRKKN